jgi:hypothetical protein
LETMIAPRAGSYMMVTGQTSWKRNLNTH